MWISSVLRYVWRYLSSTWGTANSLALWLPTLALFLLSFALLLVGGPAGQEDLPGAGGLRLLRGNRQLLPVLAAFRRERYLSCAVPLFLLGARFLADKPNLRRAVLLGEAAPAGDLLFRPPHRGTDHVNAKRPAPQPRERAFPFRF